MRKEAIPRGDTNRRSARILALEKRARELSLQKNTKPTNESSSALKPNLQPKKRKGRKCKSLNDLIITTLLENGQKSKPEDNHIKTDLPANCMSKKQTLEFAIDILQRRDVYEIFAQPVDPDEVDGYYQTIKEPMDFGTMRAKLQEGMYTSLEQFERDVYLICNNAMTFNSSTTVFYSEARSISELAQRVFHVLRTEPENFELMYWRSRRQSGRQAQGEAGSSRSKPAKRGRMKDGPRNVGGSDKSEIERRMTYFRQNSSLRENDSLVSTVYGASKALGHVGSAPGQYTDSLLEFVKDLGPTAKMVADKKLGKHPTKAKNLLALTSTSIRNITDGLVPVPSSLQKTAHFSDGQIPYSFMSALTGSYKGKEICADEGNERNGKEICANEGINTHDMSFTKMMDWFVPLPSELEEAAQMNDVQIPYGFMSALTGSYKGKEVCVDEGISIRRTCEGDITSIHNGQGGRRTYTNNDGYNNWALVGEKDVNANKHVDVHNPSIRKMNETIENIDLIIAALVEVSQIQNKSSCAPSGSYFPLTSSGGLLNVQPSKLVPESQPALKNSHSRQSQTTKALRMSQAPKFPAGLEFKYANGEGPINAAAAAGEATLDHRYRDKFVVAVQPTKKGQVISWGLPSVHNLPIMQNKVTEQSSSSQNAFVEQELQVAKTHHLPIKQNLVNEQIPWGHNAFMHKLLKIGATRNLSIMENQVNELSPSQNALMQQELQAARTLNLSIEQNLVGELVPLGQNTLVQQQLQAEQVHNLHTMQNQNQVSEQIPSVQNVIMQQQLQAAQTRNYTVTRNQVNEQMSSGQIAFMQQQLERTGTRNFDIMQNQVNEQIPLGQNAFMEQLQAAQTLNFPIMQNQINEQILSGHNALIQQQLQDTETRNFPIMQNHVNEQLSLSQNAFVQQQLRAVPTEKQSPFPLCLLEVANPPDHESQSSMQSFWNGRSSSLMDVKQHPDLSLQL